MNSGHSRAGEDQHSANEAIADRLGQIEVSLVKESWLPIAFRGLLATELPVLEKLASRHGSGWRNRIAKQVMALALASWIYAPSPLESETVARLQALDLELNISETYTPSGESSVQDDQFE